MLPRLTGHPGVTIYPIVLLLAILSLCPSITGKSDDINSPDYVPTVNLGYRKSKTPSIDRYNRATARSVEKERRSVKRKLETSNLQAAEALMDLSNLPGRTDMVDEGDKENSGSLLRSLQIFREASCDGETIKMTCPRGMLVTVVFAQYGRRVPSTKMCPPDEGSPKYQLFKMASLSEDTECLATTSLQIVLEECQDKRKCHLVTSTTTFKEDPCPGTRKYLEVGYKCRPNEFSSETVCEGDQLELRCSKSTRIAIYSGLFGRTARGDPRCPAMTRNTSSIQNTCQSEDVLEEIMKSCHGRKRCTLEAEEYVFGSPCPPGVNKYLNIVYTCVPKRVLIPVHRHRHKKAGRKKPVDSDADDPNSSSNIPSGDVSSTSNNKVSSQTEKPGKKEDFPADAQYPGQPKPNLPPPNIGKTKEKGSGKDDSAKFEHESSTICTNDSKSDHRGPSAVGLLTDWLNAFNFISRNKEKAVLYLVLGVAFGVICLLFLVIIRLAIVNKRRSKAKLDISEPTHEDFPLPTNHLDTPTLERAESVDRIEVVRFNPMRSRDFATCTLRSDIGDRSLTNYYG